MSIESRVNHTQLDARYSKLTANSLQILRRLNDARLPKSEFWHKAHALVLDIYRATQSLPKEEVFGLTIQLRRSATAIATRIAEGSGRDGSMELAADLRRAQASCNELEYLIELARDLSYWKPEPCAKLTQDTIEVRKMIYGYLRSF